MVSELDYLLLEHRYFRMIWTFAFGKCSSREALRFLVVLILIGTRAVLTMREYCMRWVFQLLPILDFSSHGISVLNVKSWGGS